MKAANDADLGVEEPSRDEAYCEVCGEAVHLSSAMFCERCRAPYHVDCWHFVGACSIFGCGCTTGVRRDQLVITSTQRAPVVIDEDTTVPLAAVLKPLALGWVRKMAVRVKDMPKTLAAGTGGAFVALAGMWGFERAFSHLYTPGLGGQKAIALVIGVTYGLVSPFLSGYQLEHPGKTALAGLLAYYLIFFHGPPTDVFFGLAIGALILASSAVAELALGIRSRLGRRIGRLGVPARMATAWLVMAVVLCVTHPQVWYGKRPLILAQYLEIGLWALLSVFAAGTALEAGKEEMKKMLPEHLDH